MAERVRTAASRAGPPLRVLMDLGGPKSLAKTGLPSRAEITDAAMGGRAECVMLDKGPHIPDAMRTLDNSLKRMQAHQSKKRPLLRALKAWSQSQE